MRVVFATDGSPSAVTARDLVASLAWPEGTAITLLTAVDIPPVWLTEPSVASGLLLNLDDETLERGAMAELNVQAEPLAGKGWAIEERAVRGRPASVILDTADLINADLIVLGSRGHGPIASMLLGSVSAEVADRARCAVLVVRGSHATSMLVATDGSQCSSIIPRILGEWRIFEGLPAVSVSVTPVDSPAFELMVKFYTLGGYPLEAEQAELRDRFHQHAVTLAEQLTALGIPTRPEVREGDAAHEIISLATEIGADIVVTGSHCLHGLDRWILGSVARNVLLHTHASVLIVRGRDELVRA